MRKQNFPKTHHPEVIIFNILVYNLLIVYKMEKLKMSLYLLKTTGLLIFTLMKYTRACQEID